MPSHLEEVAFVIYSIRIGIGLFTVGVRLAFPQCPPV